MTPADKLRAGADTWEEREKQYGSNFKRTGAALASFFPGGLTLQTPEEFTRFSLLLWVIAKTGRYSFNFGKGGHADSLQDLSVYAAILGAYDETPS